MIKNPEFFNAFPDIKEKAFPDEDSEAPAINPEEPKDANYFELKIFFV